MSKKVLKKKPRGESVVEVHVKSYDRKPYRTKKTKKKISPKRTRAHIRLLESITKLSSDIAKDIEKEKKRNKAEHARLKVEMRKAKQKQIKLAEGEKDQRAKLAMAELKRQQAVLEERNKLAAKKYEGLVALDKFRRERIPVALGSPAAKKLSAMKAREIYEDIKSNIINNRALAYQQVAEIAKRKGEAAQFLQQAKEAEERASKTRGEARATTAQEKQRALNQLEQAVAVKIPKVKIPLPSVSAISEEVKKAKSEKEAKEAMQKSEKRKADLEAELREEALKRGLPAQTELKDIVSLETQKQMEKEKSRQQQALEALKLSQKQGDTLKSLKAELQALKAMQASRRIDLSEKESERKAGKPVVAEIKELKQDLSKIKEMISEKANEEKQMEGYIAENKKSLKNTHLT